MSVLETIHSPEDVKRLAPGVLPLLCEDVRKTIIDTVLRNGGHLASSLGTVELVVGLLRTFDFRQDRIIFDVGHQAYAYKLLTDRKDRFSQLRTSGGISGYPKRAESPYDAFDVGHSSTSISAALGYAKARDLLEEKHHVVAVIGDGALLNGMAMEALNHARDLNTRLIIILNDNEMSINGRVGGLASHLARLSASPFYRKFKETVKEQCRNFPKGEGLEEILGRFKSHVKTLLQPTNLFEELDLSYWGPFDGHDVEELEGIFNLAMQYHRPLLLHVITKKGKGYVPAEDNPAKYHGVGKPKKEGPSSPLRSWSAAASAALEDMAARDSNLVCLTAAMKEGTKLGGFERKFPERFFDVGIAEGHMLTFAAGMAAGGMHPAVCIYSTFLQRAMDQLVHDMAMQKLPVLLGVDRAGLVGEDGETHHGLFDISWCRSIPNVTLAAPRDETDLQFLFSQGFSQEGPVVVRYPRGNAPARLARKEGGGPLSWGKGEILREGEGTVLLGIGSTLPLALEVRQACADAGLPLPGIVDLRFVKPLDEELLEDLSEKYEKILVLEEGNLAGGLGELVAALLGKKEFPCNVFSLGVPDRFIPQGTRQEQWEECDLTVQRVVALIRGEEKERASRYASDLSKSGRIKEQGEGAHSGRKGFCGRAAC